MQLLLILVHLSKVTKYHIMKKITTLFALALIMMGQQALAQAVNASEIMEKAISGDNIVYKNVTIKGIVDITPYQEKKDDLPSSSWWSGNSNTIEKTISSMIRFENCVFEDAFLAYFHDDDSENTFVTHFDSDVSFINCQFKEEIAFKYSEFEGDFVLAGSVIGDEANFKYAEFNENADFSRVVFNELANFKYAEYEEMTSYANTTFNEEANFKYAEMEGGVNFTNALFNDFLNFKYTELEGDVILTNFQVKGDIDTKYTEVNGEDFTAYLLKNK